MSSNKEKVDEEAQAPAEEAEEEGSRMINEDERAQLLAKRKEVN
jgi:hypothetical protein